MTNDAAPQQCDLLVAGGTLITRDPAVGVIPDGAVAIGGTRIVAIGAREEVESGVVARRRLDASDRLVIPGLVNTHNHTPLMIVRGMVEDLGYAPAYTPNLPQGQALSAEEAYLLSRLGAYELLRFGSTTVADYYRHPESCARALSEAGLRVFVGGRIHDADTAALVRGEWRYDPTIGTTTLRENLDLIDRWHGKEGGRVQCFLAPHAPDTCSPGLWREVARLAQDRRLPVHTHLHQSEAEVAQVQARDGKRPVDLLDDVGLLGPNLVAAHCIWVDDDEVSRLGRSGVRVAHAPVGNASAGMIAPAFALARAGATMTLGTDTKCADMFEAMRMAIAMARVRGASYAITADTVFDWATTNGAAALGLAGEVGRLAPGYRADLVILDRLAPNLRPVVDGAGIVVHSGCGANVETAVIDGRIVLEDGRPTCFDAEDVVRQAQSVASRLWRQQGYTTVR